MQADAEALPFADGAFDVALGAFLVNHLPDAERGGRRAQAGSPRASRSPPGARRTRSRSSRSRARAAQDLGGVPDGPDAERYAAPERLAALVGGDGRRRSATRSHVETLDALWDGVRGGTVRTAARLEARDGRAARRPRARRAGPRLAEPYRTATGYALPVDRRIAGLA